MNDLFLVYSDTVRKDFHISKSFSFCNKALAIESIFIILYICKNSFNPNLLAYFLLHKMLTRDSLEIVSNIYLGCMIYHDTRNCLFSFNKYLKRK